MKGYIGFDQYKLDCIIGVYPHERQTKQTIFVDLQVEADFSKCSKSDDIADTVNYEQLAELCIHLAESGKFALLETFACEILKSIFLKFNVTWAWVRIKKPQALANADYTVVELERYKDGF